jgi:hypothetical protein
MMSGFSIFKVHLVQKKLCCAPKTSAKAGFSWSEDLQGLKPDHFVGPIGTTEVVP